MNDGMRIPVLMQNVDDSFRIYLFNSTDSTIMRFRQWNMVKDNPEVLTSYGLYDAYILGGDPPRDIRNAGNVCFDPHSKRLFYPTPGRMVHCDSNWQDWQEISADPLTGALGKAYATGNYVSIVTPQATDRVYRYKWNPTTSQYDATSTIFLTINMTWDSSNPKKR
jgi:hypothetical protein